MDKSNPIKDGVLNNNFRWCNGSDFVNNNSWIEYRLSKVYICLSALLLLRLEASRCSHKNWYKYHSFSTTRDIMKVLYQQGCMFLVVSPQYLAKAFMGVFAAPLGGKWELSAAPEALKHLKIALKVVWNSFSGVGPMGKVKVEVVGVVYEHCVLGFWACQSQNWVRLGCFQPLTSQNSEKFSLTYRQTESSPS